MKEFKLEIDTNTIYVKAIRFIGTLGIGFVIGSTFVKYQAGIEFELLWVILSITWALLFSFFPISKFGSLGNQSLRINEDGLFLYLLNSKSPEGADYWGTIEKISWEKIKLLTLKKGKIYITPKKGSVKKLHLPLYTQEQWNSLESYLRNVATHKGIEYV